MSTPPYSCKACGLAVIVLPDGHSVWACAHEGGGIVANMSAVVNAHGGVVVKRVVVGR